jgi:hypothetical protein
VDGYVVVSVAGDKSGRERAMANAILSPSLCTCQNLCSATFERSRRTTSTFGCELQVRKDSRCSKNLGIRASGRREDEKDDVGELESALGVEMKTVRRKPTARDPSQRRLFVPSFLLALLTHYSPSILARLNAKKKTSASAADVGLGCRIHL